MPLVPNLSTPYLQSTLELSSEMRTTMLEPAKACSCKFSGVYANIGGSLYDEWMGVLQRGDDKEAHDLLAFAMDNRPPMEPRGSLVVAPGSI